MKKLTIRKFKVELRDKHLKILQAGERHKDFTYPVFEKLPKDWCVNTQTPLEVHSLRTPVCFAGDIAKNEIVPYWLDRFDWERNWVIARDLDSKSQLTFYADAVALIPMDIVPSSWRLKLLHESVLIDNDKEKRKERHARRTRSSKSRRSVSETQEPETDAVVDSRSTVDGQKEEAQSATELQTG